MWGINRAFVAIGVGKYIDFFVAFRHGCGMCCRFVRD
jgi:hypothetical protein